MVEIIHFPLGDRQFPVIRQCDAVPTIALVGEPVDTGPLVDASQRATANSHRVLRPCCRVGTFGDPL